MEMGILAFILLVLVLLLAGFIVYDKSYKRKRGNTVTGGATSETINDVIKAFPGEIITNEDEGCIIGFQGGRFAILDKKNVDFVTLFYNNFYELSYPKLNLALDCVNKVNYQYNYWTCYLDPKGNPPDAENPLTINLSNLFFLSGNVDYDVKRLRAHFMMAFRVARDFEAMMRAAEAEKPDWESLDFKNKLNRLKRKFELGNGELKNAEGEPCLPESVEMIISQFDRLRKEDVRKLTVVRAMQVKEITDPSLILSYNVKEAVMDDGNEPLKSAMLLVEMDEESVAIVLEQLPGSSKKSSYYQITVTRTEGADSLFYRTQHAVTFATTFEVRHTTKDEDYWELKYMLDEIKDKTINKEYEDLTDEQKAILQFTDQSLQSDAYWGHRYFTSKCYLQSLSCFRNLYDYLIENWSEINDNGRELFYRTCFYLGFIYMEFNEYERAFYFTLNARRSGKLDSIQEFVNCISNMKDPGALAAVNEIANDVLLQMKKDDDPEGGLDSLYSFLRRRTAYILINMKDYAKARTVLEDLLKSDDVENQNFARNELQYLDGKEQKSKLETKEDKETDQI